MSNYGFTEHEHNWWAARYRNGSAMLVIGWILVAFGAFLVIYLWSSLAVGSSFWPIVIGALVLVGFALVGLGVNMRKRPMRGFVEAEHRQDHVA
jgi:hypothetical protein